ncbi:unnamed protein product [Caretta caretta]
MANTKVSLRFFITERSLHTATPAVQSSMPWGTYTFLRLPFGIKSASDVFQQKRHEPPGDIAGIHIVAGILIIPTSTQAECDKRLKQVMTRARAENIKFNPEKIQLMVKEVKYVGHILSSQGIKPDDSKVEAIANMKPP